VTDIFLTQSEADALIEMEKHSVDNGLVDLPDLGGVISVPLVSANPKHREKFLLDISRGRIDLIKGTHQMRGRQVIALVRLDFGGQPHRNPDGEEVGSPHLHIYREGFGDKWAVPVPEDRFQNLVDRWKTLFDFLRFCNITREPNFQRGIFT
jgi:hypothetical protein